MLRYLCGTLAQALVLLSQSDSTAKPGLAVGLLASAVLFLSYLRRIVDTGDACSAGLQASACLVPLKCALATVVLCQLLAVSNDKITELMQSTIHGSGQVPRRGLAPCC